MGLTSKLSSNISLGISIFLFSILFSPFEDLTTIDLSTHMLQHFLISLAGFLIGYPYLSSKIKGKHGSLAFLFVSAILVYWHLPVPWDDAVLNPFVHALEHISFLLAGILIGSVLVKMSDTAKVSMMLTGFFGHTVYAILLIYPSNRIYYLYSYENQYTLGVLLLLSGALFLVGVGYFVARNPDWLGLRKDRKQIIVNYPKVHPSFKRAKFAITVFLIAVLISYFSATLALASSSRNDNGGVTVYIEETPFTWNFNPRNVTLILGVNSTVTWISRSVSYDTVTDSNGIFSSGPIPPGGKFTFTFEKPGVYHYYCMYHPWMTGYVIVKEKL
jgi:plastocyanin